MDTLRPAAGDGDVYSEATVMREIPPEVLAHARLRQKDGKSPLPVVPPPPALPSSLPPLSGADELVDEDSWDDDEKTRQISRDSFDVLRAAKPVAQSAAPSLARSELHDEPAIPSSGSKSLITETKLAVSSEIAVERQRRWGDIVSTALVVLVPVVVFALLWWVLEQAAPP